MLISILHFLQKVMNVFEAPQIRVRAISEYTGQTVYGTVRKQTSEERPPCPDPITYWTVVWDDRPKLWETYPAWRFIWTGDGFTITER